MTHAGYWEEVRDTAGEAVVQAAACAGVEDYGLEASEFVFELVDQHRLVIYYYGHGCIMEHTENYDAVCDVMGHEIPGDVQEGGWLAVRGWFAFWAFHQDVLEEVACLGRVAGGLQDELEQAERLIGG